MSAPSGSSPRAWLAAIVVAGACTGRPAGVSPSDRPATTMAPLSVPRVDEIRTGTVGGERTSADTAPRVSCRSHCRAGRPPLYVIDGAVVGRSTPPTLDRSLIDTVILLRGPEGVRRYGASGTDGVVEIRMLRPDSTDLGLVPADQPLSAAQAATVCGRAAGHAPIAVIDGRILTGDAKIEASWPLLRWDEVLRRDYYTADEAMADFGKAGRYGAYVYATSYAGFADSSIHRRPPDSGFRIRIRGAGVAVADTEPLMVVDGRPFVAGDSIVRSISPDEIEAIDVVHCMKAVVRFGRRASRGAVLITMKARAPRPPKSR